MLAVIFASSAFVAPLATPAMRSSSVTMSGGKGFGGGEATRDPEPTYIDPNDPKGKQQAIHAAESFAEYLAKRGGSAAAPAPAVQSSEPAVEATFQPPTMVSTKEPPLVEPPPLEEKVNALYPLEAKVNSLYREAEDIGSYAEYLSSRNRQMEQPTAVPPAEQPGTVAPAVPSTDRSASDILFNEVLTPTRDALQGSLGNGQAEAASVGDKFRTLIGGGLPSEDDGADGSNLMQKVKDAGIAGIVSYMFWEVAFWGISIPVGILGYEGVTGHWPDFSNADDMAQLGAEAFAFVNLARFAVPIRIGLALATVPWVQSNIVDRVAAVFATPATWPTPPGIATGRSAPDILFNDAWQPLQPWVQNNVVWPMRYFMDRLDAERPPRPPWPTPPGIATDRSASDIFFNDVVRPLQPPSEDR